MEWMQPCAIQRRSHSPSWANCSPASAASEREKHKADQQRNDLDEKQQLDQCERGSGGPDLGGARLRQEAVAFVEALAGRAEDRAGDAGSIAVSCALREGSDMGVLRLRPR